METKHLPSHTRHAFRWRLLVAIVGLIVLDHFLVPAHAAHTATQIVASVTAPLR